MIILFVQVSKQLIGLTFSNDVAIAKIPERCIKEFKMTGPRCPLTGFSHIIFAPVQNIQACGELLRKLVFKHKQTPHFLSFCN